MRVIHKWVLVVAATIAVSGCVDPNEEKGICSYLGTCEMGLGTYMDFNYCKELGSCDDGKDPTEYTASGKPSIPSGGGITNESSGTGASNNSGSE